MRRIVLLFILVTLVLTKIAVSSLIEVNIFEEIKGDVLRESKNISFGAVKFSIEFLNTGSIAYSARARIYIYKEGRLIFNGWSQEKSLMPGDIKNFDIYWLTNSSGKYESKLRMYFGNEINESEKDEFQVETLKSEDVFEITSFRTYDDHVVFDIRSKNDAKNVIIIPSKYSLGWIFEQKTLDYLKKDSIKTVSINYHPTVWESKSLKLAIASNNGNYYSEKTVEMKKEEGILGIIYSILDGLKTLF